uniref:Uncharacterized protein n=1 Tax=Candidatus Kentrum sp. UNK TaxID=2126344 RepID=A0A450ZWK9_9GAMM|nr:MAG: hypothetical protein BECKUNK1418G_GA0071005_100233 [Candidatus Kentron sp. UNK]VFK68294.1 MAG: hypothetical protein BECKUNK1418H_GA0071006_100133 [Candidatus Kentron sp. UNK]
MKLSEKDQENVEEKILSLQKKLQKTSDKTILPLSIGEHVLSVLERGEPLTVDTLIASLSQAANSPVNSLNKSIAKRAIAEIKRITTSRHSSD